MPLLKYRYVFEQELLIGNTIYEEKGAISEPEGGGDLAGKVHVAGGVHQVHQEPGCASSSPLMSFSAMLNIIEMALKANVFLTYYK
jgi:hypothetical protein